MVFLGEEAEEPWEVERLEEDLRGEGDVACVLSSVDLRLERLERRVSVGCLLLLSTPSVERRRRRRELRVLLVSEELLTELELLFVGAIARLIIFRPLSGSALIVGLRHSNFLGDAGKYSTGIPLTASTINCCHIIAAVVLAPLVGVLLSLPSQIPVTSWGI